MGGKNVQILPIKFQGNPVNNQLRTHSKKTKNAQNDIHFERGFLKKALQNAGNIKKMPIKRLNPIIASGINALYMPPSTNNAFVIHDSELPPKPAPKIKA